MGAVGQRFGGPACTWGRVFRPTGRLAIWPSGLTALTALTVLTVLTAPLEAQIRGVLITDVRPGHRAPALVLPVVTDQGVGEANYDLRLELGRVVVLGFCPSLADAACAGFWRWAAEAAPGLGSAVSLVMVGGAGPAEAAAFAAREGVIGRILVDDRQTAARRWGIQGAAVGRIGVYVVTPEGVVSYRDLQLNPDDLHGRTRLEEAIRAAREGR